MDPITNLVLLPGLDGTEVFFRPFLAALPPSIRPLVVTYPRSGPNDYKTLLQLVLEKVAHLPTFFLLGSSFSGPLAILLAAAHPARLRGLILSATFLRAPKPHLTRYKFAAVPPVIWSLRFARRFPVWLGSPRTDPFRLAKSETWRLVPARALARRAHAALTVDVRALWPACPQPALCIAFDQDQTVPAHNAREIVHLRPSTRLVTLAGGHMAMLKNPGPWTAAILDFILQVSASAPPPS